MSVNHPLPWRASRIHPDNGICSIYDANGYVVCGMLEDDAFEIVEAVNGRKTLEGTIESQAKLINNLLSVAPPAPVVFPASLFDDQFRDATKKDATREELAQEITKAVLRVLEKRESATNKAQDGTGAEKGNEVKI